MVVALSDAEMPPQQWWVEHGCEIKEVFSGCIAQLRFWSWWIMLALWLLEGHFATSPEPADYPQRVETVRRPVETPPKSGNPKKKKKKKYIEERQIWHVVTFDACLKPQQQTPGEGESAEPREVRGSWVKQALELDPEAVLYLDRDIAPTSRTLRHPRFTHKRGQTIEIRGHHRRIPVKVRELMHRITRVVASRYESSDEEAL